ncbi:MAG: DUF4918 family protein [Bacteroidetes bacterium]|nr:DUF4918 family protein [Bacteroidota bacterium]
MWSEQLLEFYRTIKVPPLPSGIEALTPWKDKAVFGLMEKFYEKFYGDSHPRTLLIGINPGRLGGGTTGIPFTDPIRLEEACGIKNHLMKKAELSSAFFYEVIERMGGPKKFYSRFYVSSVVPFGFSSSGKNLNYYDDANLLRAVNPMIPGWMDIQLGMGIRRSIFFPIGEGKNAEFLMRINERYEWFEEMIALPHPRFIMQYKRKRLKEYIDRYVEVLSQA